MTYRQTTRRAALAGLSAAAIAAPALAQRAAPAAALTPQDKALVDSAVAYLQGMTQARGRFVQTDHRGQVSRGEVFLKRPGKVRFAYDPPTDLLVVSDGNRFSIHNRRLRTFDQYPLVRTPLSIFLAKEIRLDRGVVITQVRRLANGFAITARDGKGEAEGQIELVFDSNPVRLREWTTVNAERERVRVVLSGLTQVASLDPALFTVRDPRPKPGTARPR